MLEQILKATEDMKVLKSRGASYEELKDAATKVLLLRQEAETKRWGKPRTKLTAGSIASLLR